MSIRKRDPLYWLAFALAGWAVIILAFVGAWTVVEKLIAA